MLRVITEVMAILVQNYMVSSFVCTIYKVKQPYNKSFAIANLQQFISWITVNFLFYETPAQRILSGTMVYVLVGFFFFEGSRVHQVFCSISEYALFFSIDLMIGVLLYPSFVDLIQTLPPMDQKLLGRNLATATLFIMFVAFELFLCRKDGKQLKGIMVLGIGLGMIQIITLNLLSNSNLEGMIEEKILITLIFSIIMIGGYLVVMEMFRAIQRQQKKQSELEQISLERRYQYDYYQKAYTRSEAIRDMRHDMRNQLQAIQYRFHSEEEESRMRAEEMVNQLCEKIR